MFDEEEMTGIEDDSPDIVRNAWKAAKKQMKQNFKELYYQQPYSMDENGKVIPYQPLDSIVPEIYGEIKRRDNGELYTTDAQRTGCSMCGFGIHLEERPHRFDRLRERNPQEWNFWMYRCCTDPETGEKYGWGRVLDYIGVEWEDVPAEQMEMKF